MNKELKIGDTVEYKGKSCVVMVIDGEGIGINYYDIISSIGNNCMNDEERKSLYRQGWEDDDSLFWIYGEKIKLIKKLRDFK